MRKPFPGRETGNLFGVTLVLVDTQHDIVVYIYEHTNEHATCSSTKSSQIQCCLTVNIREDAPNISQSYPYHRLLLFYHDNSALLPLYQKALAEGCADLQADIDTLQSILSGKVTHINWNTV